MGLPLTENDLQGSIDLAKLADSIFAIAPSRVDAGLRYLKHIKSRSAALIHDETNVLLYRLGKYNSSTAALANAKSGNFLGLAYEGPGSELEHVKFPFHRTAEVKREPRLDPEKIERAGELFRTGYSYALIGNELGVGKSTAGRYVLAWKESRNAEAGDRANGRPSLGGTLIP